MQLSIIIPVFNNESTLKPLFSAIDKELSKLKISWEIIFVNDKSTDGSITVLGSLKTKSQHVVVLDLPENLGQNAALFEGLKVSNGQYLLIMDADLQDDPRMIPVLYNSMSDPVDITFIKRIGNYQSVSRMISSQVFKYVLQLLIGLHHKAGTFFIMKRSAVDKIMQIKVAKPVITVMTYSMSQEIRYITAKRENNQGISSYTFISRCRYAIRALKCAFVCKWYRIKS